MATSAKRSKTEPKLAEYRRKRDPKRTPEPVPAAAEAIPKGKDDTFVIQEHHATALHWDFRLERDGVLVSWAIPKGMPPDPKVNHLAVHTEDHPLEYATFAGHIPKDEYGGGSVTVWDRGTYETEKWTDREVKVVLRGSRVEGRFVLFQTGGKNWMIHRMDAPARPDWEPLPELIRPMMATTAELPRPDEDQAWAYELKWDGVRAVAYVDGGRVRLMSRNDRDITVSYPEIRPLGEQLGATQVVLDGEIVTFDDTGRPSFGRLQQRMHVASESAARRLAQSDPVVYLVFDVLHLDGRSTLDMSYQQRRELLEGLRLDGEAWQVPAVIVGHGSDVLNASREQGMEGLVAKRLNSTYHPGRRSPDWRKIKNFRTQEVVIAGWKPGKGRREGQIGSLLLGIPDEHGLRYVGHVGTGFTDAMLADLGRVLRPLRRETSPFATKLPAADARDAVWVNPKLVGEVAFGEWTGDHRLRHPAWRGLRDDKTPEQVKIEP